MQVQPVQSFYTAKEAATILNVAYITIKRSAKKLSLPKLFGNYRFTHEEIEIIRKSIGKKGVRGWTEK